MNVLNSYKLDGGADTVVKEMATEVCHNLGSATVYKSFPVRS